MKMDDPSVQLRLLQEQLQQAQEQTRRTTFEELLESCHDLSKRMTVQPNKNLRTKGSTSSPKGKRCPQILRPWLEFPSIQQEMFDSVYSALHPPDQLSRRLFSPRLHIQELGRTAMRTSIGSEADLRLYHNTIVENFVTDIISTLANTPQTSHRLHLGEGVSFENHANTLSDFAEEVQFHAQSSNPLTHFPKPTHADQICTYKRVDGQMELLFVIEYKAPHKLTKEMLRVGLRVMDLPAEVIHRSTIPTDPQEKFSYNADRLVGAAVTQTYSYMLDSGLEYSCIVTGDAIVFLWIKEDESSNLYYHLAEPNEQVHTEGGLGFPHPLTAVGQLLSFCLLSFQSHRRNQRWREASIQRASIWEEDWNRILQGLPQEGSGLEAPASAYKARRYVVDERSSPYYLRKRRPKSPRSNQSPNPEQDHDDHEDSADDMEEGPESITTPSKKGSTATGKSGQPRQSVQSSQPTGNQQRPYCTQACLLGMVRRSALDLECPNIELHRCGKDVRTHLLDKPRFRKLVRRQLAMSLDNHCRELGKQGIRGATFQITLSSHGYTFVGKATRDVFVPFLQHESRVYDQLHSLQGKMVPVSLGSIDLEKPWRDLHVELIHMLLMSWGGERADYIGVATNYNNQTTQFEGEIKHLGVQHNDLSPRNILWNDELERLVFIDFEAATFRKEVLQEVSVNAKRKRENDNADTEGTAELGKKRRRKMSFSTSFKNLTKALRSE